MLWGYILLFILPTHSLQASVFSFKYWSDHLTSDYLQDHLIGPKPSRSFQFDQVPCYPSGLCLDLKSRCWRPSNVSRLLSLLSCDGTGQSWRCTCTWRETNPIGRLLSYWNKVTVVLEASLGDGSNCCRTEP